MDLLNGHRAEVLSSSNTRDYFVRHLFAFKSLNPVCLPCTSQVLRSYKHMFLKSASRERLIYLYLPHSWYGAIFVGLAWLASPKRRWTRGHLHAMHSAHLLCKVHCGCRPECICRRNLLLVFYCDAPFYPDGSWKLRFHRFPQCLGSAWFFLSKFLEVGVWNEV